MPNYFNNLFFVCINRYLIKLLIKFKFYFEIHMYLRVKKPIKLGMKHF